jgi:segregation and condensation protein B
MNEQAEIHGEELVQEIVEPQVVQGDTETKRSQDQEVALLEALLLAHGDPIALSKLQEIFELSKKELMGVVDRFQELCHVETRGVEVVVVGEKLQIRTKSCFAEQIRQVMAVKPRRLSQAALETLSVIAYRQPIVKSEMDKIRGVDVSPTLKTLSERQLIKILGYQASAGQPALYGTTDEFLKIFGLPSLSALPAIGDLKALMQEPGEAQEAQEEPPVEDDEEQAQTGVSATQEPSTSL